MSACRISSRATSSLRRRCCPRAVSLLAPGTLLARPRTLTVMMPMSVSSIDGTLHRPRTARGVIRVGERCEPGSMATVAAVGRVRPRSVPARLQARGPVRGRVGPDRTDAVAPGARSMPHLHDGHRDAHGRLPPRSPRDPRRVRRRRHRVPVVLGLRGGLARRGVQQVPGGGGLHARARPSAVVRATIAVPVAGPSATEWIRRALGRKGYLSHIGTTARVGRCSRTSSRST